MPKACLLSIGRKRRGMHCYGPSPVRAHPISYQYGGKMGRLIESTNPMPPRSEDWSRYTWTCACLPEWGTTSKLSKYHLISSFCRIRMKIRGRRGAVVILATPRHNRFAARRASCSFSCDDVGG